jgi:hypothetical protein
MKEEILDIAKKLYHNHLTPELATDLLLRLFDVSGSFMCAHGAKNKCNEQCFTCSEDEKCDVKYSYKATMTHYFQFTEWIAERYNYIGGEWCCWCAKQYDIKDTERYKDTGELWAYWWENCR